MEGSAVLQRVLRQAPDVPDTAFGEAGEQPRVQALGGSLAWAAKEALLLREHHALQMETLRAKRAVAQGTICADLACVTDPSAVDAQIAVVLHLQRRLASLEGQLPALLRSLQQHEEEERARPAAAAAAAAAAGGQVYLFDQENREAVLSVAHDMVRLLARGTAPTADALKYFLKRREELPPALPCETVGRLQETANGLLSDLNCLLTSIDKLELRTSHLRPNKP